MKKIGIVIFMCCLLLATIIPLTVTGDTIKNDTSIQNSITITTPIKGNLYAMGAQIASLPFDWTIIIGPITIRAEVTGINGFEVDFYIDGELKDSDPNAPFEYAWWDISSSRHTIEVKLIQDDIVQDTDSIQVFKIF